MKAHLQSVYTHCAVNCYPHCLDLRNELICFATANSVALYDLENAKIVALFSKHQSPVNSVRWIGDDCGHFVSSSVDKTCIIWERSNELNKYDYKPKHVLSGSGDSVIVCDSVQYICPKSGETSFVSVSSSNDQILRVWKDEKVVLSKSVKCFVFDIKLYQNLVIPGLVVLTTGSDELVHLNRFHPESGQLECLVSLKGHGDWIKSLDLFQLPNETLMIASGSQDCLIRVYSIRQSTEDVTMHGQSFELITENEKPTQFVVNLETVLSGHEGWVTEVRWHFDNDSDDGRKLHLLSSSMDKTIILWEQMDQELDSIWNEKVRLGEVGGNAIGFLGCTSAPSKGLVVGYSFNGAVSFWHHQGQSGQWQTSVPLTGHFNEVTDLTWESGGEFFLTCSADQTTRVHSYWTQPDSAAVTWHEIGRPQVHGYDLKCIAMAGRGKLVSGADEKVIRVFAATKFFVDSLQQITGAEHSAAEFGVSGDSGPQAECAVVPALGLSNSAVYESTPVTEEVPNPRPKVLTVPPTEELLLQSTLWPETQKLYGHGYEIFALAVNRSGTLLASACKAANLTHAAVILWDLVTCKRVASLQSHSLTVTQLRFSPDDRHLLSVSRDRTWALFDVSTTTTTEQFPRVAFSDKATGVHSRIIWDCAWTPDSAAFVTVSRDKTAVLWTPTTESQDTATLLSVTATPLLTLHDSITSVDVCGGGLRPSDVYVAAFGLEKGHLLLYSFKLTGEPQLLGMFDNCHTHTINRVRFCPKVTEDETNQQSTLLATCSNDRSVRLFRVGFTLN